jgi:hypothetical protein
VNAANDPSIGATGGGGASGAAGWAVRLPRDAAASAGSLRLRPGILAADAGDVLWLRGEQLTAPLELELRKLPGAERFELAPDGTLTPRGARIPTGTLPASMTWQPLATFLAVAPRPAALAGQLTRRAALRLVRTNCEERASVLVTTLPEWTAYAVTAPLIRLRPLRFAVAADGRALVRGTPLPPLAGRRYVEREGIAVPSGFTLEPALEAASIRALIEIAADALALFGEDGTWERIDADDFVRASRAGARATAGAWSGALKRLSTEDTEATEHTEGKRGARAEKKE